MSNFRNKNRFLFLLAFIITLFLPNILLAAVCNADGSFNEGSVAPIFGVQQINDLYDAKLTGTKGPVNVATCLKMDQNFFGASMCHLQEAFNGSLFPLSCRLCTDVKDFANIALQVFLLIFGIGYVSGILKMELKVFIKKIFKFTIILVLINNHDTFYQVVYSFFTDVMKGFYCIGNTNGTGCSNSNIFTTFDQLFRQFVGIDGQWSFGHYMLALIFATLGLFVAPVIFIFLFTGVIVTFQAFLRVFVGLIMGVLMLSVLLAFFCVFVLFFLLPQTKVVFERYMVNIISYAMEPLAVMIVLGILISSFSIGQSIDNWKAECIGDLTRKDVILIADGDECKKLSTGEAIAPLSGNVCFTAKNPLAQVAITTVGVATAPLGAAVGMATASSLVFPPWSAVIQDVPVPKTVSFKDKKCVMSTRADGSELSCMDSVNCTVIHMLLYILQMVIIGSLLKSSTDLVRELSIRVSSGFFREGISGFSPSAISYAGLGEGYGKNFAKGSAMEKPDLNMPNPSSIRNLLSDLKKDVELVRRTPAVRFFGDKVDVGKNKVGDVFKKIAPRPVQKFGSVVFRGIFGGGIANGIRNGIYSVRNTIGMPNWFSSRANGVSNARDLKDAYNTFFGGSGNLSSADLDKIKNTADIEKASAEILAELAKKKLADPNIASNQDFIDLENLAGGNVSRERWQAYQGMGDTANRQAIIQNLLESNNSVYANQYKEAQEKLAEAVLENKSDATITSATYMANTSTLAENNLNAVVKAVYEQQRASGTLDEKYEQFDAFKSAFLQKTFDEKDIAHLKDINKDYYDPGITFTNDNSVDRRNDMTQKLADNAFKIATQGSKNFFS
jgi:hypothetical protein